MQSSPDTSNSTTTMKVRKNEFLRAQRWFSSFLIDTGRFKTLFRSSLVTQVSISTKQRVILRMSEAIGSHLTFLARLEFWTCFYSSCVLALLVRFASWKDDLQNCVKSSSDELHLPDFQSHWHCSHSTYQATREQASTSSWHDIRCRNLTHYNQCIK